MSTARLSRWRRRRDERHLSKLGFISGDLDSLAALERRRLSKWTVPTYELTFLVIGLLYGAALGAAVVWRQWSTGVLVGIPEAVATFVLLMALTTGAAGPGAAWAAFRLMCLLDRYQSFGDAAGHILRWIRFPVTERLARKERCLRLTRRWAVQGRRSGLELSRQETRILDLLAGELTEAAIKEIHDLVRVSLLDAAHGRIDPHTYEIGQPRTVRGALRLLGEIAGVAGVLSTLVGSFVVLRGGG